MKPEKSIRHELNLLYRYVGEHTVEMTKEYWESEIGKILKTKINVLEWVLEMDSSNGVKK